MGGDSGKPGGAREGRQGRDEKEASKVSSSKLTPTEVAWERVETGGLRVILPAVCGGRRAHSPAPVSSQQQVKAAPGRGGVGDGPPACLPCPGVGWRSHSQADVLSKHFAFAGGTQWGTTSTFFRCHSDSHPQKVAVFSPKPTFKDHVFIGEKASLLPPPGLAVLLTHTLSLSFPGGPC